LEIQFQRNFADYQELFAAQARKSLRFKITFVLIFFLLYILASAGLVFLGLAQSRAFLAIFIVITLAGAVFACVRPYWIRRDFEKHPNFARPVRLQISEAGIHSESDAWTDDTKWNAYLYYRETENLFMLYLGSRSVEAIPKRAFSAQQLAEFREFVRANLSNSPSMLNRGNVRAQFS
jgi:hypothetical protein